ncbi:sensor histidine kinase [Streptomyces radiopugnans]|uniref:histidine kinase n=1 Tax=Streptomyces radiopugnans TaxID=403935 RepID=A0A1H9EBJ5_9ACTN|nr:histidine kinase [Streptomyces radiopugnans]SEQ23136.1 Signal transduction histidine kinase [Streptomyces radiopugnans]
MPPIATSAPRRPVRLLAAAVVLALVGLNAYRMTVIPQPWPRMALDWALVAAGCGALYWRRRRPVPVALAVLLCAAVYYPANPYDSPLPVIAFAVALYTVAAEGRMTAAVTLAVLAMLAVGYGELAPGQGGGRHVDDAAMVLLTGWLFGVIAAGHAQRSRQAYLREVEQRAVAAEREKEVRARQSAVEERLRIARELHDVIGHSLSLINVQSGAVLHRHTKRPGETRELVAALEAVRAGSRDALRELRATLGVLRQADEEAAPTAPAAGLEDVGALVERASAAGLDARLVTEGLPGRPVPPQVGLAAYRIVQESLTNAVRHSGARRAVVTVRHEEDAVRVRIEDDGHGVPGEAAQGDAAPGREGPKEAGSAGDGSDRGPGGSAAGSGIEGMAERARALGGGLTAGNVRGEDGKGGVRGYRVEARLPLGKSAR